MRFVVFALLMFFTSSQIFSQEKYTPSVKNMASRIEFEQARFGIFIHWGIYSMLGDGEWVMHNKNINYKEYEKLAGGFYPSRFNAAEWVKAIKESGAKYICITSRHHDGFSIFKTQASPYNSVDATPFKRDILAEIASECQKQGIRLHFYYSHIDWGREDYYPVGRTGHGTGRTGYFQGKKLPQLDSSVFQTNWAYENYLKFMDTQLTELLTNYGPIGAIWFDGLWDRDKQKDGLKAETWNLENQYALIHRLQPGCLVGNNHHMDPFPGEDIQIFERDIPGQNLYGYSEQAISTVLPLETCQTMNRSWGYRVTDTTYKSEEFLVKYLVQTAAKGANLLLNIGPRPDGTLPGESLQRLNAIGKWLNLYGETIYGTTRGDTVPEWGASTRKGERNFLHIFTDTSKVFLPMDNPERVLECKDFLTGAPLKYRVVSKGGTDSGLEIETGPQVARNAGVKVVEYTYMRTDEATMEAAVEHLVERYPQIRLQDIYKSFFQDHFGPAHIMGKRENVINYLKSELEQMERDGGEELSGRGYAVPCGIGENYLQVSLGIVRDGIMTLDEFADAFIAGGGGEPQVTDVWLKEWELMKKVVKKVSPEIEGFREDVKMIDSILKERKYVVHHSRRFDEAYKPHYRIIRKDIYYSVILPRIKNW